MKRRRQEYRKYVEPGSDDKIPAQTLRNYALRNKQVSTAQF